MSGETTHAVTPVVFLRNLPHNTSEQDVADACAPFGLIHRLYMAPSKHLAFVQFDSVATARRALAANDTMPVMIHGQQVLVTASQKPEVIGLYSEPPFSTVPVVASAPSRDRTLPRRDGFSRPAAVDALPPLNERRVILVQLINLTESVSMDEFYTVFAHFGTVVRMSYFIKEHQNRLLVEYQNHDDAYRAVTVLRNCDIGICEFYAEWSILPALTFSQIDKKNRDYSLLAPVKPTERAARARDAVAHAARDFDQSTREASHGATIRRDDGAMRPARYPARRDAPRTNRVLFVRQIPPGVGARQLLNLFGQYGDVTLVRILFTKRDQALVEMESADAVPIARQHLDDVAILGGRIRVDISRHEALNSPTPSDEATDGELCAGPLSRASSAMRTVAPTATLHVSNIHVDGNDAAVRAALREKLSTYGVLEAEEWIPPPQGNTRWMGRFRMDSVESAVGCVAFLHQTTLSDPAPNATHHPRLKVAFALRPVSANVEPAGEEH